MEIDSCVVLFFCSAFERAETITTEFGTRKQHFRFSSARRDIAHICSSNTEKKTRNAKKRERKTSAPQSARLSLDEYVYRYRYYRVHCVRLGAVAGMKGIVIQSNLLEGIK